MTKSLKYTKEDCLNFRLGGKFVAPVAELLYEEYELKSPAYMGRKLIGYDTVNTQFSGHAILKISYPDFLKLVDFEKANSASFSSNRKPGLAFDKFAITLVKKYSEKETLIEFRCFKTH